ncbi:TPA: helix-turn-helix domain-containing protein [Photobacterium damselae]
MIYTERLKLFAERHGQQAIADTIQISQVQVSRIINKGQIPRADKLLALSELLEMDLKALVTELTEQSKINENRKNQ